MHAYLCAMRAYGIFQDRTSRADYWRAHLEFGPLILVAFFGIGVPSFDEPRSVWPVLLFMLIVGSQAVLWAAPTVRRLHDMNLRGWWALLGLASFIPVLPLGLIVLLILCARDGQASSNRFGPDPLGRKPAFASSHVRAPAASVPTPTAASQKTTPRSNVIAELERLAQLRTACTLSEAEFAVMKEQILKGERRA